MNALWRGLLGMMSVSFVALGVAFLLYLMGWR